MFSSNPFPQIPSPIHVSHPLNPFFDLEKDGVYFNHHEDNNNPFVSGDSFFHSFNSFSPPPSAQQTIHTTDHIASDAQDFDSQNQLLHEGSVLQYSDNYNDLLESVVYPSKKKVVTSKKDGHSKIYTAQGPRDRRQSDYNDILHESTLEQRFSVSSSALYTYDQNFVVSEKWISQISSNDLTMSHISSTCELVLLGDMNHDDTHFQSS
ncbi:hypothetical protein L1987_44092 [Smallanthus sonchifolius]|uniref:Uncharacterized protein n=1 Tax=Smallanthus sonchifolius TaxID=185202 RepID=A0ACB9GNH1_9ASTR|nr:hypothetical protein L1987_44092 [Smallanthus sonchifolius]